MLLRHYFRHHFDRTFEVEAFARSDVQLIGNRMAAAKSLYVTSAQNACFAACGLLDYLIESDVDMVVQAATYQRTLLTYMFKKLRTWYLMALGLSKNINSSLDAKRVSAAGRGFEAY